MPLIDLRAPPQVKITPGIAPQISCPLLSLSFSPFSPCWRIWWRVNEGLLTNIWRVLWWVRWILSGWYMLEYFFSIIFVLLGMVIKIWHFWECSCQEIEIILESDRRDTEFVSEAKWMRDKPIAWRSLFCSRYFSFMAILPPRRWVRPTEPFSW